MPLVRIMAGIDVATGHIPRVGKEACQLGVRPRNPKKPKQRFDVSAVMDDDLLDPVEAQGLSCSAGSADDLIRAFFRPLKSDERVWELDTALLPAGLLAVHRPLENDPDHWQIEPEHVMTLAEFQGLLAATAPHWHVV